MTNWINWMVQMRRYYRLYRSVCVDQVTAWTLLIFVVRGDSRSVSLVQEWFQFVLAGFVAVLDCSTEYWPPAVLDLRRGKHSLEAGVSFHGLSRYGLSSFLFALLVVLCLVANADHECFNLAGLPQIMIYWSFTTPRHCCSRIYRRPQYPGESRRLSPRQTTWTWQSRRTRADAASNSIDCGPRVNLRAGWSSRGPTSQCGSSRRSLSMTACCCWPYCRSKTGYRQRPQMKDSRCCYCYRRVPAAAGLALCSLL